jgi:hypothetical protein
MRKSDRSYPLFMAERKVTQAMAEAMAQARAVGVSYRALGRLYGIAPSLAHRHVHRVNGERPADDTRPKPEPDPLPEPEPEEEPDAGGPEPSPGPRRAHAETEFPLGRVDGFEPADWPDEREFVNVVAPPPRPPDRAPGQDARSNMHPLDYAEHQLKCVRMDVAHLRTANLPDKLAAAEERERLYADFIDTWADAYATIPFGRPSSRVKVGERTLRDGPSPSLWSNPYDTGPRGFTVVGS